jgi:hypothetical protein
VENRGNFLPIRSTPAITFHLMDTKPHTKFNGVIPFFPIFRTERKELPDDLATTLVEVVSSPLTGKREKTVP